jgi:hypothetical protein
LRWSLRWGPHLKSFEARAKRTGLTPAPLLSKPKLKPHDHRYLLAYNVLNRSRQWGMSAPQPIQISEAAAYLSLIDVDAQYRPRYLRLIQDLDGVFLEHAAEKAAQKAAQGSNGQ